METRSPPVCLKWTVPKSITSPGSREVTNSDVSIGRVGRHFSGETAQPCRNGPAQVPPAHEVVAHLPPGLSAPILARVLVDLAPRLDGWASMGSLHETQAVEMESTNL